MNKTIWVPWIITHKGNQATAIGYESRRAAYRSASNEETETQMIVVKIIPKKFLRSEKPVPKKRSGSVRKKKRK